MGGLGFGQGYFGQYATGGGIPTVVEFGPIITATIRDENYARTIRSTNVTRRIRDTNDDREIEWLG